MTPQILAQVNAALAQHEAQIDDRDAHELFICCRAVDIAYAQSQGDSVHAHIVYTVADGMRLATLIEREVCAEPFAWEQWRDRIVEG